MPVDTVRKVTREHLVGRVILLDGSVPNRDRLARRRRQPSPCVSSVLS